MSPIERWDPNTGRMTERRSYVPAIASTAAALMFGAAAFFGGGFVVTSGGTGDGEPPTSSVTGPPADPGIVTIVLVGDSAGWAETNAFNGDGGDTHSYSIFQWDTVTGDWTTPISQDTLTAPAIRDTVGIPVGVFNATGVYKVRALHAGTVGGESNFGVVDTFTAAANVTTLLFREEFEDTARGAAGWFDGPLFDVDSANAFRGGASGTFTISTGNQLSDNNLGGRRLLGDTVQTVYVRWRQKNSASWNDGYHTIYMMTSADATTDPPAFNRTVAYLEQGYANGLFGVVGFSDRENIDTLSYGGVPWAVGFADSTTTRAVNGCNGSKDGTYGGTSCFRSGAVWWNDRFFMNPTDTLAASDTDWHLYEYEVKLNDSGAVNGTVRVWVDSTLVQSRTGLELRTEDFPNMGWNNLIIGPFLDAAASTNMTVWMDELEVWSGLREGADPPRASDGGAPGTPATPTATVSLVGAAGDSMRVVVSAFSGDPGDSYDSLQIQVDTTGGTFASPQYWNVTLGAVLTDTVAALDSGAVVDIRFRQRGSLGGWSAYDTITYSLTYGSGAAPDTVYFQSYWSNGTGTGSTATMDGGIWFDGNYAVTPTVRSSASLGRSEYPMTNVYAVSCASGTSCGGQIDAVNKFTPPPVGDTLAWRVFINVDPDVNGLTVDQWHPVYGVNLPLGGGPGWGPRLWGLLWNGSGSGLIPMFAAPEYYSPQSSPGVELTINRGEMYEYIFQFVRTSTTAVDMHFTVCNLAGDTIYSTFDGDFKTATTDGPPYTDYVSATTMAAADSTILTGMRIGHNGRDSSAPAQDDYHYGAVTASSKIDCGAFPVGLEN